MNEPDNSRFDDLDEDYDIPFEEDSPFFDERQEDDREDLYDDIDEPDEDELDMQQKQLGYDLWP